ncbi:MAG: hypothetical protein ACLGGX_11715 [Bdellovibrionia bacterium]
MKKSQLQVQWRRLGLTLVGLSLLVSFQNCSQSGFETDEGLVSEEAASESETTPALSTMNVDKYGRTIAKKLDAMPLAYSVGFNQITYNSCSGKSIASKAGMFSLKFGAYGSGGLRVSQEARNYYMDQNNFRPIAPATELTLGQKKNYLYDSPLNRDLVLQMAWRTKDRPGWLRSSKPVAGKDYKDLTMNLSDDRMLDPLVKSDQSWVRHFPFATETKFRNLEGFLFYNDSEGNAEFFRDDLQSGMSTDGTQGMVAFAFRKETGDPQIPLMVNENSNGDKAYGVGYTFGFGSYGTIPNNPTNIMKTIDEIDLNTGGATGAVWSCPNSLVFKIVRREDAAANCPTESFSAAADVVHRQNLAIVRNQLPAGLWDVNISRRCVVPKGFECYPNETRNGAVVGVNYSGNSQECFQAHKPASHYSAANPGAVLNYCAQHISICLRTQ